MVKVISAEELSEDAVTYLIYAAPGVGKTTSLKYIPGKKLVIDVDKSSTVLRGEKDIDVLEVNTHDIWNEWIETIKFVQEHSDTYDVIVVDNVSELFRSVLTQLGREGKNNRVPGMDSYQRVDFVIMDSFRALKNVNKTLVFTAWETSDVWNKPDGQQFNRAIPDVRKTILNNFLGLCDVVARLVTKTAEDGDISRGFILQPTESVYAKNRLDDRKGAKVEELFKDVSTP